MTLEERDIFFCYRPKVDAQRVQGIADVQRFSVILRPWGWQAFRRMVIGRKRLPAEGERAWAVVDQVARSGANGFGPSSSAPGQEDRDVDQRGDDPGRGRGHAGDLDVPVLHTGQFVAEYRPEFPGVEHAQDSLGQAHCRVLGAAAGGERVRLRDGLMYSRLPGRG